MVLTHPDLLTHTLCLRLLVHTYMLNDAHVQCLIFMDHSQGINRCRLTELRASTRTTLEVEIISANLGGNSSPISQKLLSNQKFLDFLCICTILCPRDVTYIRAEMTPWSGSLCRRHHNRHGKASACFDHTLLFELISTDAGGTPNIQVGYIA